MITTCTVFPISDKLETLRTQTSGPYFCVNTQVTTSHCRAGICQNMILIQRDAEALSTSKLRFNPYKFYLIIVNFKLKNMYTDGS